MDYKRIPKHIGFIPDGNRRWALKNGFQKHEGYYKGINPGFLLYEQCLKLGIEELTFYGFTQDNTKRPSIQTKAFCDACIRSVDMLSNRDADLLVIGNTDSKCFPPELLKYTKRIHFGKGLIKINFLVNYGWHWDISTAKNSDKNIRESIASHDISRIDLIIRWGGRRRLSGFLPIQSVYADFYIIDDLWPDFKPSHLTEALDWYQHQDITLGG